MERLKAGGEGDDRAWDGWMASPTQWTWVWVNSRSWWWTGRPTVHGVAKSWTQLSDWTEWNILSQGRKMSKFPNALSGYMSDYLKIINLIKILNLGKSHLWTYSLSTSSACWKTHVELQIISCKTSGMTQPGGRQILSLRNDRREFSKQPSWRAQQWPRVSGKWRGVCLQPLLNPESE